MEEAAKLEEIKRLIIEGLEDEEEVISLILSDKFPNCVVRWERQYLGKLWWFEFKIDMTELLDNDASLVYYADYFLRQIREWKKMVGLTPELKPTATVCKWCGREIYKVSSGAWYSQDPIFPLYCNMDRMSISGNQKHEPEGQVK